MLWDVYINVDVTNLISANDVSHRTYWKAKIIGAKIYKLCGRWRRKEKGQLPVTVVETLHGGRWRSSNPVGQKQSHDRDQDYEFADIASSSIWVCFKQNCDDFRSECPLLFWLLNSPCEWQIAMFLNWWNLFLAKTIPQINKEYLLLTPGFEETPWTRK